MAKWRALPGITKTQQIDLGGGVNLNDPPHLISDNQASKMSNVLPYNTPILTPRYPASVLGGALASPIRLLPTRGPSELLKISGGQLWRWNTPNWVSIRSGLTASKFSSCNFNDKLLISSQDDGMISYDGMTVGTVAAAPHAAYIINNASRVYATGISGDENLVKYSAVNNDADWTSTGETGSGYEIAESPSGEKNTGMASLTSGRIIVFKSTSFFELFGTGPMNYEIVPRYYGIGCIAHDTIVTIDGYLYWLGLDGVYRWGGSGVPVRISDPIKPYIPNARVGTLVFHHAAGTDGRFYYISLGDDLVFAFDTKYGTWWGPLAYDHGFVYAFGRLTGTGDKGLYAGFNDGFTRRIDSDEYEFTGSVAWSWETKAYADGSLAQDKQLLGSTITAEVFSGATFSVYMSNRIRDIGNSSDWYLVKSVTAADLPQKVKIYLSPTLMPPSEFYRIKFTGAGKVDIYGIDKEVYVMPRS